MKNGFTLTELLAVMVILSILLIIAIPAYNSISTSVRKSNLDSTKTMLSNAMLSHANKYLIDDIKPAGENCNEQSNCCKAYSIDYIVENQVFITNNDEGIIDSTTGEKLEGFIIVKYDKNKLELVAEYSKENNGCQEV